MRLHLTSPVTPLDLARSLTEASDVAPRLHWRVLQLQIGRGESWAAWFGPEDVGLTWPVAIGGLYPDHRRRYAWIHLGRAARERPTVAARLLWSFRRTLLGAASTGDPIMAELFPTEPEAVRLATAVGFQPFEGRLWALQHGQDDGLALPGAEEGAGDGRARAGGGRGATVEGQHRDRRD